MVERVWWLMKGFEALSGININLDKTEFFPINLPRTEAQLLASVFGCKIGTFPFKYLGLPLHYKKLMNKDWDYILKKWDNKLQSWHSNLISIGGRKTLINAALSSVSLYALSIFPLPKGILHQLDKKRRKFLWQGNGNNRKGYALIAWEKICTLKE